MVVRVVDDRNLIVEVPAERDGAALVARVVEHLPPGACEAISLRRPNLGDAFLARAGSTLDEPAAEPPAPRR